MRPIRAPNGAIRRGIQQRAGEGCNIGKGRAGRDAIAGNLHPALRAFQHFRRAALCRCRALRPRASGCRAGSRRLGHGLAASFAPDLDAGRWAFARSARPMGAERCGTPARTGGKSRAALRVLKKRGPKGPPQLLSGRIFRAAKCNHLALKCSSLNPCGLLHSAPWFPHWADKGRAVPRPCPLLP